jgi:lipooligosaccharide transport system permease protein
MSAVEAAASAPARPTRRVRRLDRAALTGVLVREVVNFGSYWRASAFSSTVEPTIYLIAFGFGFGSLVSTVNGLDYVQFVGTGTVATAVLFSSVFPAMFGTFVK